MYFHPETNRKFALHSDIRAAFPSVLFPDTISDSDLEYCDVFLLIYERPQVGPQQVAEPSTIDSVGGQWTQLWTVRDATPAEIEASKPPVPQQISSGQGREALYNVGLFANVQPAIDAIDDADAKWRVQNAWDYRPNWERQSPFVTMMAAILGLDDEQTNQLFIAAAQL